MPLWVWGPVIIYLSLLFFASLWAAVERTRSARERTRRLAHAEPPTDELEQEIAVPPPSEVPQP